MPLDPDQFGRLVLDQLDSLYRVALRLTRNHQSAEDLVQETCYKALRSRETFKPDAAGIRPWLVRILRNTFLTSLERDTRRPAATDTATLESLAPPAPSAAPAAPSKPNFSDYMDQELVRALDALSEEYRTVLVLWALEDFSYQEIADALDVPIGTVMSRLHRARARLTKELADYARTEGLIRE